MIPARVIFIYIALPFWHTKANVTENSHFILYSVLLLLKHNS